MLFIAAGLGLRRICISFAISIKIASVLAGAHGIIEWLVCITPWCWCYQFPTSTRTKIRPASLKNKGSDKLTTCIHILIHHSFYNWGNGTADDLHEVISYDLIPERFLKDTWRTVEGQILLKQMIKKIKYSQQFLFMALPLVISTSPGKRLKHLRGRKTAIQGKDSAAFNAVNSPLPLVCKLSLSLRCSICHFPHLPASHHHLYSCFPKWMFSSLLPHSSIQPRFSLSLPLQGLSPQAALASFHRGTQESLRTAGVFSPVLPYC